MTYKKKKTSKQKTYKYGVRNTLEVKMWEDLLKKTKRKKDVVIEYETEKLPYVLPSPIRRYIPDFIVRLPNRPIMYIEVKGYLRPEDRAKMIAVKRSNPTADIRIVFAKESKLSSRLKMTNVDWAHKYGFKCAVGHIPREWLR